MRTHTMICYAIYNSQQHNQVHVYYTQQSIKWVNIIERTLTTPHHWVLNCATHVTYPGVDYC